MQKCAVRRRSNTSLIYVHCTETGHNINFEGATILDFGTTKGQRLVKEAYYSGRTSINRHIDLPPAYQAVRFTDSTRQEKWPRQTTANPPNHHDQEQGQEHKTPVAAPGEPATANHHQPS